MTKADTTLGLACPRCGGMVPIPEGQLIAICPYCELRSVVHGERGLLRYQVPQRIQRDQAAQALGQFFRQHRAIAADAGKLSRLEEAFLVYLPFWASWARAFGWVFGQERIRRDKTTTYKPREIRFVQEVSWNGAACDVGEFGVGSITLSERPLEVFNADQLHAAGMVFEPVGSAVEASAAAQRDFEQRVEKAARLDRISQVITRFVRKRFGLVYYPLWVLRYGYRGRSFQVVVDGFSGQILFGKAPGNSLYRAAVLVGGMAAGALLAVDGTALAFAVAMNTEGDSVGGLLLAGLIALVAGFGIMGAAYRTFRFGEQFEFRQPGAGTALGSFDIKKIGASIEDLETWINRLS